VLSQTRRAKNILGLVVVRSIKSGCERSEHLDSVLGTWHSVLGSGYAGLGQGTGGSKVQTDEPDLQHAILEFLQKQHTVDKA